MFHELLNTRQARCLLIILTINIRSDWKKINLLETILISIHDRTIKILLSKIFFRILSYSK